MKKLKLLIISVLLLTGGGNFLLAYNCDPSGNDWIGNGYSDPAYTNAYKVCYDSGVSTIVNIQKPGFASAPGVYVTVPAGISSCSLGAGNYDIQGAGIILHVDAFTEKYTDVTITHGLGEGKLTFYYKNGTEPTPPPTTPSIKVSPKSLSFKSAGSQNLTVTLSNLTADVSVVSSNSTLFEIDKTSIDKSTASATVKVTCKTTDSASETITFKSTGAEDVEVPVYFKTACDGIDKTSGSNTITIIPTIEADGYYFVIKGSGLSGLGGSYIRVNGSTTDTSLKKYAKNTSTEIKCGPFGNIQTDTQKPRFATPLYVMMPSEVNFGTPTFTDADWCRNIDPSMSVDPAALEFMAQDEAKTFQVTAAELKQDISISSNSDNFTVSPTSITKAQAVSQDVTVTCVNYVPSDAATITLTSGDLTKTVAISTTAPSPVINITPSTLSLNGKNKSGIIKVTPQYLTNDVTITSNNSDIEVVPAVISKDATGTVDVTVTSNATTDVAGAVITFASEGATSKTATVSYTAPKEIVFTSDCKIDGAGVFLYFDGYGSTYLRDLAKYTASVTSTLGSITSITPQNPTNDYLYCAMNAAPLSTDITKITLTYENGDTGTITFKGSSVLNPSMSVSPTSLVFMAEGSKTVTVTAEALKEGISITSLSSDFSVSPDFIPAGMSVSQDVTITCNEFKAAEDFDIIFTSGSLNQSVNIKTINPTPTLSVTPTSALFREVGDNVVVSVDAEYLSEDISIAYDGDLFTVSPASIPANSTFPVNVTITNKATEAVIEDVTFSSGTLSEYVSITVTPNTPCNGLYDKFADAEKQAAFQYAYGETPDGYLSIVYTFENELSGLNPQLSFNGGANWKGMTNLGNRQYSYTTNSADHTASVDFSFKLLVAYTGHGPVVDVDYQFGTCPAPEVKPIHNVSQNKWYDLFADAMTEAASGDQFALYGDITESAVINKSIKLNGRDKTMQSVSVDYNGKLEIIGATNFNTLIIKSKPNVGAGQVFTSVAGSATANAVYAEREFRDSFQQLWYSLALPFACDAASGLYNTNGTQITKGVWFNEYNSQKRADTGLSSGNWDYVTSLSKGTAYMIYMNEGINTVRFKAANPNDIFTQTASIPYYEYNGSADAEHHGWNFMAQPMSSNAWMGVSAGSAGFIQVLREGGATASDGTTSGQYSTVQAFKAADVIAPYTAFMFQTDVNGEMSFHSSTLEAVIKSAEYEEPSYFKVTLSDVNGNSDATFVSASEDASATEYEIGKDLAKCGSSSAFVQITTTDLGLELTVNQAKAYNGEATIPLLLNCPAAGIYTVSVAEMSEIGDIYLLRNGAVVCDLGFEGYTFNVSEKQLNKDYSLLIKLNGGVYTDADGVVENSIYAKDRVIYVNGIYATEITNIAGQSVSNPVPEKGVYVVEDVKISVE